ncbi:MAG TPA: AAA family ATPase, partial [Symbiobacteriaceae bacterium]|nr:AAA family ATPase [Symbiobacteriaceae bacterium]
MRIEEMVIAGFGRLQGRRLTLEPGLNLVYGPNESGKTTLQKFLLAMLYGMQKRGAKRTYSEDADRYRPWGGGDYRGTLIYALESGRRCRVEREFTPGRDRAAIFDAQTGADLSGQFEQDRRKELLFGAAHLGLDEETFRSTAWVGQMAVGRLDLGRELVARVANLQESGREDLSVKAALGALDEHSKAIGSERTPARPYGRVLKALADKREALERAQGAREQVRGWEGRLQETRAVLAELEAELDEARRRLDWALLLEAEERSQRVAQGTGRVDEL